jgi:signal transduction histidine kinase
LTLALVVLALTTVLFGLLWLLTRRHLRQVARQVRIQERAGEELGARLRRSRALREELVERLPDPALLFGADGHLVRANPSARERFGAGALEPLTPTQVSGSPDLARAVDEARHRGGSVELEVRLGDRDLAALAAPIGDEVLLVLADRTARRRVDAVRRDFVANASHELKTPVSGIQALAEALTVTAGRDPERARALAERLGGEAARLATLVHTLLDLRRLEEDGDLAAVPVDLVAVVRSEVERVRPLADDRQLDVVVDLPERAVVAGVEEDLRLIAANLLDNAVGYNRPGGEVRVALRRRDAAWELEVADTGIGIARSDVDRVFERFYRVDVARSRATGGTGLGLSIVRHAAERHGGTVTVDSILGEGSTFTVVLPVEPSKAAGR